jgi:hypothetical protein
LREIISRKERKEREGKSLRWEKVKENNSFIMLDDEGLGVPLYRQIYEKIRAASWRRENLKLRNRSNFTLFRSVFDRIDQI